MNKEKDNNQDITPKLNRAQKDLSVLYEVSQAMRTTLELNSILYIILTGVTSHKGLGFNRAVLFLHNIQKRCLEAKMAIGPASGEAAQRIWDYISNVNADLDDLIDEGKIKSNTESTPLLDSLKDLQIPLTTDEDNILANAFHLGNPLHITKERIADYQNDMFIKTFETEELVIMPLKAKDKVKGLIIADNHITHKKIDQDDLKIFLMLANQAGLAIENSQLYEQVKEQNNIDSLTNLWNHGYFQSVLSREISKEKQKLSLLFIDIDNFKKLNDTHGHQIGDIVIKEIAQILKDSSRETDYPCRYGGEEFSIILTDTGKDQAYSIAERIRENISEHNFEDLTSGVDLNITVSIGIATHPTDATDKQNLIKQADKAMYISKLSGKNQTTAIDR